MLIKAEIRPGTTAVMLDPCNPLFDLGHGSSMRARLAASPLSDHARLAREIERAYAWMVGQAGEARIVETQKVR